MKDSSKMRRGASGPSPIAICLKLCTSAWVMAPTNGVITKYVATKIATPMIRVTKLGKLS